MRTIYYAITFLVSFTIISNLAVAAPDVSDKIVLANLDRYDAQLRFGTTRREVKPKKASVLSPKKYPVTVEYWSGNTTAGWKKHSFTKAGTYGLNFKKGHWSITELKKGTTTRSTTPPTRTVIQQRVVQQPVRRLPNNADRNRWSPLARVAYAGGRIYQFVRDEQDRDLLRHLLIRAREDDDLDRVDDWLRDSTIALPHKEELRDIFRDLSDLKDADWNEIDTADEKDWDVAKADLGDLISDKDWSAIDEDFADIDTSDFWEDDVDLDVDDIDFADLDDGNFDIGDDLDIDTDNYDLGGYDDFGGYDGAFDVGGDDFGGDFGGDDFGDDDFGDFGGFDDFDF
ncbi:MAG: hypothetical protein ACKVH8_22270 [Pirellulales bacterium]